MRAVPVFRRRNSIWALLSCLLLTPVAAQEPRPGEHVREDYAQVLSVVPVYQVLNANHSTQMCSPANGNPRNCRETRVPLEYSRPVAYDVEYTYRGVKYRSRLPINPGRRLRIRIGITPLPGSSEGAPPSSR